MHEAIEYIEMTVPDASAFSIVAASIVCLSGSLRPVVKHHGVANTALTASSAAAAKVRLQA